MAGGETATDELRLLAGVVFLDSGAKGRAGNNGAE